MDLYTEKAGILDGEADTEVDLGSHAYQIWKNAIERDPALQKTIPDLPDVVYSTKPHTPTDRGPEGVLVYVRTAEGNDALAWLDRTGKSITESQYAILKAAECEPETPAVPRHANHHSLVRKGMGGRGMRSMVPGSLGLSRFLCPTFPCPELVHLARVMNWMVE